MSNLDNFHPFRQSVNLKDSSSSNNSSSNDSNNNNNNNNQDKDDGDYKPLISWKTKFRLLIFGLAGSVLLFVLSSALESFDFDGKFKLDKPGSNPNESAPETPEQIFDKNDLNERGREVSQARRKAGIFAAIFCKGGKRSTFCD